MNDGVLFSSGILRRGGVSKSALSRLNRLIIDQMKPASDFREELFNRLASHGLEVYKENSRVISLVEDKAQKVTALAGVFLGVCLTIVNGTTLSQALRTKPLALALIPISVALLLSSVIVGALAMRVRVMTTMTPLEELRDVVVGIAAQPDHVLEEPYRQIANLDLLNPWIEIHRDQRTRLSEKANLLNIAQALLAVALVCCGVSTILCLIQ